MKLLIYHQDGYPHRTGDIIPSSSPKLLRGDFYLYFHSTKKKISIFRSLFTDIPVNIITYISSLPSLMMEVHRSVTVGLEDERRTYDLSVDCELGHVSVRPENNNEPKGCCNSSKRPKRIWVLDQKALYLGPQFPLGLAQYTATLLLWVVVID